MKQQYENLNIEIIEFDSDDIITESGPDYSTGGGSPLEGN